MSAADTRPPDPLTAARGQPDSRGMPSVLEEIAGRIRAIRESGDVILPPLLLLGVMERVGSNWVSDTLRPVTGQHNEPFRQQLSPAHPLSALNQDLSLDAPPDLGPYGRHWLVMFAATKHASVRQVIKETNLFFALPALLNLFPHSPVAVLTRSPLGVASSFARLNLFRRWDYRTRYRQVAAVASRPGLAAWAGIVPDDGPPDLVALARLQVLNTLIIARALTACLTAEDADEVGMAAARALSAGRQAVPALAWDLARDWASGDRLYSLTPPQPPARRQARRTDPVSRVPCPVGWVPGHSSGDLRWRNLLVTNDELAAFLNEMTAAGVPNCMDGCYLLAVEMPHERGGRLHYNQRARRWTVSPGFDTHPAYWVTWTGAAALAARHGARLPSRAEMIAETCRASLVVTNHGYQAGDAIPVTEPGRAADEIHHLVGNLQAWCCDGPAVAPSAPASRWLHGAAWNTPGTPEEIHRPRARHLSGASRGVGIRLVRDQTGQPAVTARELATALTGWLGSLAGRDKSLRDLDEALAGRLAALSQPYGGLRPHVGAGPGEPGDG